MPAVDKECVSHHMACECREKMFRELIELHIHYEETMANLITHNDLCDMQEKWGKQKRLRELRKQLFGDE